MMGRDARLHMHQNHTLVLAISAINCQELGHSTAC